MRYYKLSESRVQEMFGRFCHISNNKQEMVIVTPKSSKGENDVPNLDYVLPFPGVPLKTDGQVYDIRQGFQIQELAKDYYHGFDESTIIIPGSKIKPHPTVSKKKQLYVTFDPCKTNYILIGRKCNQDTDQLTRKELCELADFASMGTPKSPSEVYWDYYILPFRSNYNYVADRNDRMLTDAKFAATFEQIEKRKQLLRNCLENLFGSLSKLSGITPIKATSKLNELKTITTGNLCGWHYFDGLRHTETWVIDEKGRSIKAKEVQHSPEVDYTDVVISIDMLWENIPDGYIAIRYERKSFSEPAAYTFLQKPAVVTAAQMDRLCLIEENLSSEVREIVMERNLFERFALRGKEASWTLQLHDDEVVANALNEEDEGEEN